MPDRARDRAAFLADTGWSGADCRLLAADASFRSYYRVRDGERSVVLMDAPPSHEDVTAFERLARFLVGHGFSAPRPLAVDRARGFMLLEDLGDTTYTRALAGGHDEHALYRLATDLLVELHRRLPEPALGGIDLPAYDEIRLLDEAALLVDWTLPAFRGGQPSRTLREGYLAAWRSVLPLAERVPRTLVLRDYHVDNLMVLEGREGAAGCGLLDFQDALIGPLSYDLVSLLQDARRDIADALAEDMLIRYLDAFPDLDREAFEASYVLLGAQRAAKIIGIFTRLWRRDRKPVYLEHIPRVWRLLEADLAHPALGPVRDWFEREVGRDERGIPPEGFAA
jgi:aminoglycoside/choline kinase family phosphotransferase